MMLCVHCEQAIRDAEGSRGSSDAAVLGDALAKLRAATHRATEALYRNTQY